MNQNHLITLYIIGGIAVVLGILGLGICVYNFNYFYDFHKTNTENFKEKFNLVRTIISYHYPFLLYVITLTGGIQIIRLKKSGYLINLFSYFVIGVHCIRVTYNTIVNSGMNLSEIFELQKKTPEELFQAIFIISLPCFFFTTFFILLKKIFRNYYSLNTKDLLIILGMIILSLLELFFITSNKMY